MRAVALEALAGVPADVDGALGQLVSALVPSVLEACEVELGDVDGTSTGAREGTDVAAAVPHLESLRGEVRRGREPASWSSEGSETATSCAVACVRDADHVYGTVACLAGPGAPPFETGDLAALDDVARLLGATVGRALLQRRAHDAARRSQRIASQLHQLIATSIAIAGLQRETDVLDALATRARSVFDADEAVVTLHTGPGAPLQVVVSRPGAAAPSTARPPAPDAARVVAPTRAGDVLVVPLLVRRGEPRGDVSIRRSGSAFGDDDVEVASLLAQMASSALDATELHRTIVRSEERLRVLVDTAPIGIVETDLGGAIQWWNRAASTLFDWPAVDDGAGTPSLPVAALEPLHELWASAAAGEQVTAHDLSGVELAGRRRELAASVALVAPSLGRAGSLLTVVEDVTDHRQLMEELRHAQRMDVIGQLSSSVAHDFNNLLTLIAGYAELLVLETGGNERSTQLARDIQTTTTRASTLTGKLLTMGRTKLPAPVVFSPVETVGELSEVLDRILGADVELVLTLDAATGMVRADPDQFEQMIMNLATNARDAMDEGGTLRISVGPSALGVAEAAARGIADGEYVRVEVADTGAGMDDETLRRCFEPLFTTKGPSKGTGLGLPAARRVVVESGGSIEVHSTPGHGTAFEILLPSVAAPAPREVPDDTPPTPSSPATVLLAEDDDGIRDLIGRILGRNGFTVLEAASAEDALTLARATAEPIDLLVSDVILGGMTGGELAAILQHERPDLLVVLVSGNVDATVVESVREGTGLFLAKPFKPSELVGVIAELRGRQADPGDPGEAVR